MNELVRDVGERGVINSLARHVGLGRFVVRGIGDDSAVVRAPDCQYDWVFTTDPVIEGVHFLPDALPEHVGHKAAGRVLSDIAAMGAEPLYVFFNLVATAETSLERLTRIYDGATRLCSRWKAAILGGDVARGPRLELHAFGVGRVPRGKAVLRRGARPGDRLFVTGCLGGSILGRHLTFQPRVDEGRWLAAGRWATAMLDLSDGLASDVRRLMEESHVGVELLAEAIPIAPAARRLLDGRSPLHHALCDGEDFELLFTVRASRAARLKRYWQRRFPRVRLSEIGRIIRADSQQPDPVLVQGGRRLRLTEHGYEHFVK